MTSLKESISLIRKWGTIQLVLYTSCAISLYFFWEPSLLWYSLLGYFFLSIFGLEIGHHRYFSHRSFTASKFVDRFLLACTIFVGAGPTGFWTALHRYHHKYSDTDKDPHRPFDQPILCYFHCNDRSRSEFEWNMAGDLLKDPVHLWFLMYYNYFYFGVLAVIFLINPYVALYGFIIPAILTLNISGLVNVVNHRWGYQNYKGIDSSTNNTWVNLITFGGGLHNNHHGNQRSYTTKLKWWEHDLCGWIIKNVLATGVHIQGQTNA